MVFDFSVFPILETDRCILRQLTHDDADALITLYSDPRVDEFLDVDPPCSNQEQAISMIDWLNGHFTNQAAVRWAITFKENPAQLIGTIGFHYYNSKDRRTDIGYDLMPQYWGKGIITEVAHKVVRWCFENLDLHRVQADCTDGNIGSEKVLLKLGFKVEGLWRENCFEHGRFVSLKQFGLLRREYLTE